MTDQTDRTHSGQPSRRSVVKGAAGLGATALLSAGPAGHLAAQEIDYGRLLAQEATRPFQNPVEVSSADGILDINLSVELQDFTVDGSVVQARSYKLTNPDLPSPTLVGPTIRIRPGDTFRELLTNNLPVSVVDLLYYGDTNIPHGFNITNMHTHGLHISPLQPSDDVLLQLLPAGASPEAVAYCGPNAKLGQSVFIGSYNYVFNLPVNHWSGTNWYHAHKHGSVALQVASGMAGALIVEGDLDEVPAIAAAKAYEKVLVFQQLEFTTTVPDPKPVDPNVLYDGARRREEAYDLTTVNGIRNPLIEMNLGQVQLWRCVHAGVRELIDLNLVPADGHQGKTPPIMVVVAADGIPLERPILLPTLQGDEATATPEQRELNTLSPGQRLDILIQSQEAGRFLLYKDRETLDLLSLPGARAETEAKLVATIDVSDTVERMAMVGDNDLRRLRRPEPPAPQPVVTQTVDFWIAGTPTRFMVDNKTFSETGERRHLRLNATDRWRLTAANSVHPFHIHVNPFLVVARDGQDYRMPIWRDTVLVNSAGSETVDILSKQVDFTGAFVLHCHNLEHEDRGMMEIVEIS